MEHRDLQDSHHAWLEDIEYRQEFGSESAKLEIAVALAAARKTAGVTQARLAELAEVSQAYIAKLESGDANPSIGKIGQLFACLWLKPFISFRDINPVGSSAWVLPEGEIAMESFSCSGSDPIESQMTADFWVTHDGHNVWSGVNEPHSEWDVAWK